MTIFLAKLTPVYVIVVTLNIDDILWENLAWITVTLRTSRRLTYHTHLAEKSTGEIPIHNVKIVFLNTAIKTNHARKHVFTRNNDEFTGLFLRTIPTRSKRIYLRGEG